MKKKDNPSTPGKTAETDEWTTGQEQAREEIRKGECTTCRSKEELNLFLEAL